MNIKNYPKYAQLYYEYMVLANLSMKTVSGYVYALLRLARHTKRDPRSLGLKAVKDFLFYYIQNNDVANATYRQTICGIKYYYKNVCPKKWNIGSIPYPKKESTLPSVLSPLEVERLLAAIPHPVVRMMAIIAYACGLRHSEVRNLRINDIDSERMTILVRCGKGNKHRIVTMAQCLLDRLYVYYKKFYKENVQQFFLSAKSSTLLSMKLSLSELYSVQLRMQA